MTLDSFASLSRGANVGQGWSGGTETALCSSTQAGIPLTQQAPHQHRILLERGRLVNDRAREGDVSELKCAEQNAQWVEAMKHTAATFHERWRSFGGRWQTSVMPTPETVVHLIPVLEVAPECLGMELAVRIEGTLYTLGLPERDGRPNSAVFRPPATASERLRAEPWDHLNPWAHAFRMRDNDDVVSYAVYKVVLFGAPAGSTNMELAVSSSGLGRAVDDWYRRFYSWLELWTTQGLNHDQWPENGIRTDGVGTLDDGRAYSWGNAGVIRRFSGGGTSGPYASAELLEAAAELSNSGIGPSLPWDLLRRARGTRPGETRQQVINAATAAEIAIERSLSRYFQEHGIGIEQIDAILKPFTGIAEKLRLLERLIPPTSSLANRVADKIAGPRNRAAHAGWHPDPAAVENCLDTVTALLSLYDPLPQPSSPSGARRS